MEGIDLFGFNGETMSIENEVSSMSVNEPQKESNTTWRFVNQLLNSVMFTWDEMWKLLSQDPDVLKFLQDELDCRALTDSQAPMFADEEDETEPCEGEVYVQKTWVNAALFPIEDKWNAVIMDSPNAEMLNVVGMQLFDLPRMLIRFPDALQRARTLPAQSLNIFHQDTSRRNTNISRRSTSEFLHAYSNHDNLHQRCGELSLTPNFGPEYESFPIKRSRTVESERNMQSFLGFRAPGTSLATIPGAAHNRHRSRPFSTGTTTTYTVRSRTAESDRSIKLATSPKNRFTVFTGMMGGVPETRERDNMSHPQEGAYLPKSDFKTHCQNFGIDWISDSEDEKDYYVLNENVGGSQVRDRSWSKLHKEVHQEGQQEKTKITSSSELDKPLELVELKIETRHSENIKARKRRPPNSLRINNQQAKDLLASTNDEKRNPQSPQVNVKQDRSEEYDEKRAESVSEGGDDAHSLHSISYGDIRRDPGTPSTKKHGLENALDGKWSPTISLRGISEKEEYIPCAGGGMIGSESEYNSESETNALIALRTHPSWKESNKVPAKLNIRSLSVDSNHSDDSFDEPLSPGVSNSRKTTIKTGGDMFQTDTENDREDDELDSEDSMLDLLEDRTLHRSQTLLAYGRKLAELLPADLEDMDESETDSHMHRHIHRTMTNLIDVLDDTDLADELTQMRDVMTSRNKEDRYAMYNTYVTPGGAGDEHVGLTGDVIPGGGAFLSTFLPEDYTDSTIDDANMEVE